MTALFLRLHNEPNFLTHTFNPHWLNECQISEYPLTDATQSTYLHHIPNASLNYLFISEQITIQTSRTAVRNWLRVLRPNGQLIFAHTPQSHAALSSLIAYATPLIHSVDYAQPNVVRLQKSEYVPQLALLFQQVQQLQHTQMHVEALSMLQFALLAHPDQLSVYQILSLYYERLGWLDRIDDLWHIAIAQLRQPLAELMGILFVLQRGDYINGFQLRQAYTKKYMPKQRRSHAYPPPPDTLDTKYWQGEPLQGKTLVVWSEFGLGDEIMFIQLAYYLKHVVQVGKLIWVVQPAIWSLVQTNPFIDEVVNAKVAADTVSELDYWTFPHDLLCHIQEPFQTLPKHHPYLSPQTDKLAHFSALTHTDKKIKIGLAWRGDPTHENDAFRSIHQVNLLNVLLDVSPDIQFFCVQKELNDSERAWLAENQIPHFGDEMRDFADTAALLSNMDYVITVDTSIAHVAGALNLRTFVLLPYVYDWRWGTPLMKNLWYPNTEKFHLPQQSSEWHVALAQVKESLRELTQQ